MFEFVWPMALIEPESVTGAKLMRISTSTQQIVFAFNFHPNFGRSNVLHLKSI